MDRIANKVNAIWGFVVTIFTMLFGEFWFLFLAFFLLNVVDYVTGFVKARLTNTENSNKGFKGICKKVGYWVVIAIAFFVALSFEKMGNTINIDLGFVQLVGWFTLATFIINEIRSVLENLVIIGVPVPEFLVKGLEVAAEAVKSKTEGEMK
jgi:toxin secretion/phage lysis holin